MKKRKIRSNNSSVGPLWYVLSLIKAAGHLRSFDSVLPRGLSSIFSWKKRWHLLLKYFPNIGKDTEFRAEKTFFLWKLCYFNICFCLCQGLFLVALRMISKNNFRTWNWSTLSVQFEFCVLFYLTLHLQGSFSLIQKILLVLKIWFKKKNLQRHLKNNSTRFSSTRWIRKYKKQQQWFSYLEYTLGTLRLLYIGQG